MRKKIQYSAFFDSPKFKQALFEVQTAESERYWASTVPVAFSPEFERKMERLLRAQRKSYYPLINTRPKRVLLSFAVVLILLITTVFSVSALREPVVRFFVEVYEKFSNVFFHQQGEESFPAMLEVYYAPTWLPEGYIEAADQLVDAIIQCERTYTSESREDIIFKQHTITSLLLAIDSEDIQTKPCLVNGQEGLYYSNKEIQRVIWNDGQYGYSVFGPVTEGELLRIAESIQSLG